MRLTILGGGGFRVPLVYQALLGDRGDGRITSVMLYDTDRSRLSAIGAVLRQQAASAGTAAPGVDAPVVTETTDLDEALRGADFVFSAIRVGGLEGRTVDERVALDLGVLGQETVGAGGIAYGLRTLPVAVRIAQRIAAVAPQAWVINFTNPAGMVTEAMIPHLGDRVIGICDSPSGLGRRAALALGVDPSTAFYDYAGLNHLGWLRGLQSGGLDRLPSLLESGDALASFEEGRLFGADWLRSLGSIPNEYLHYYYFARETLAAVQAVRQTRGTFLLGQQSAFYAETARHPEQALELWQKTRAERESTYMVESREVAEAGERDERDMAAGGYEQVALSLMRAIAHNERASLILNVRNRGVLRHLDDDAVVEIPCTVDANGARPVTVSQLTDHQAGLVCAVKAVERSTIEAAAGGSRGAALRAFAWHPLIDSVTAARKLLDAYARELPELAPFRP
ncbi:6-phospho-beta-glucosidase [Kribbella turkmenica]|uniref:6-phospho-beta-glucosidase n=1 Tax=Kribbella turkmenica TaxID=2530375 RepID=A0A4R4WG53_9ACTN|nr:6-phospho-beta-glucosidase [Kribbella turkmenica]TDD15273.1 6-phospho-beta-glucosidase [Kribbella turkmenica]